MTIRIVAFVASVVALIAGFANVASADDAPSAAPAQSYVDRRITALPSRDLDSLPASALVDPRREEIARSYLRYHRPLFFVWAFSQVLALFVLWRTGAAARLRDSLKRRIRTTALVRFIFGTELGIVAGLGVIPASLVEYKVALNWDQSTQSLAQFVQSGIVHIALDSLALGLVVAFVLTLVDVTRLWYAWAMGGLFIATILLVFVDPFVVTPLFESVSPTAEYAQLRADAPLGHDLVDLARRAGAPDVPTVVAHVSPRTAVVGARAEGIHITKRIVLDDTLLAKATSGEIAFAFARELGHYTNSDPFKLSLFGTFLFIFSTALAVYVSDRLPFRRDDDPLARLALVISMLGLAGILVYPLYNRFANRLETRADKFALHLTHDRGSAVRWYLRASEERFAVVCPSFFERYYFYDRPPLGTRVATAQGKPDPCKHGGP
jgi:Zn-dependent protease with chaperone function